jgi:hypothetical protein
VACEFACNTKADSIGVGIMKKRKNMIIIVVVAGSLVTALADIVCHYDRQVIQYDQNTCKNPDVPCEYYQYTPSFYQCYYVASDGAYLNCINRMQPQVAEKIMDGNCIDGICSGGRAVGTFITNQVATMDSSVYCPTGG